MAGAPLTLTRQSFEVARPNPQEVEATGWGQAGRVRRASSQQRMFWFQMTWGLHPPCLSTDFSLSTFSLRSLC